MNKLIAAFALAQALLIAGVLSLPNRRAGDRPASLSEDAWTPRAPLRTSWTHVIIHHSASPTGSAAHFDEAHRVKGWDGLGYHFVIGNGTKTEDGQVEAGERWLEQKDGAHAKAEWNNRAVGVCLVGDFEKSEPSPAQMAALERVCAYLMNRCGIPPANVVGHGETAGNQTLCPGRNLDMKALRTRLGGGR